MKKNYIIILLLITTCMSFAQVPQNFVYQAVVRNTDGSIVSNRPIRAKISILQTSDTGSTIYRERYIVNTNNNGLVSLEIGTGTVETGTFGSIDSIDWLSDKYFLKCQFDPTGGTNYNLIITQQLLSVPYALAVDTATSVAVIDTMLARYNSEISRMDSLVRIYQNRLDTLNNRFRIALQSSPQNIEILKNILQNNNDILSKMQKLKQDISLLVNNLQQTKNNLQLPENKKLIYRKEHTIFNEQ